MQLQTRSRPRFGSTVVLEMCCAKEISHNTSLQQQWSQSEDELRVCIIADFKQT